MRYERDELVTPRSIAEARDMLLHLAGEFIGAAGGALLLIALPVVAIVLLVHGIG